MNEESTTTPTAARPPVNLYAAILKAQKEIKTVRKNGENPHFKNRYATLDEIWESVRDAINGAGLIVFCTIGPDNEGKRDMITHLAEIKTGEEITCAFPILAANLNPQTVGSALTYARRYTLSALLEIVTGDGLDDDGEAATFDKPDARAVSNALGF